MGLLANFSPVEPFVLQSPEDAKVVIEGTENIEILCPVNKFTGLRENPLSLIQTLSNDPVKSRALEGLFAELPTLASQGKLSNDEMFEQLQSVFADSTYYDNDKFADYLMQLSDSLLRSVGVEKITEVKEPAKEPAKDSPEAPASE